MIRPVRSIRLERIVQEAAVQGGMRPARLIGYHRDAATARVRFAAAWAMAEVTLATRQEIATALGRKCHTTIVHAIHRARRLRASDAAFRLLSDPIADSVAARTLAPLSSSRRG